MSLASKHFQNYCLLYSGREPAVCVQGIKSEQMRHIPSFVNRRVLDEHVRKLVEMTFINNAFD